MGAGLAPAERDPPWPSLPPGHVSLWREADRSLTVGDAFVTTAQDSASATALQAPELHGPPMGMGSEISLWAKGIDVLVERLVPHIGRVEPRRRRGAYRRGQLSSVERKKGWPLAEVAGDRAPDAVQDVLFRIKWDVGVVRDDVQACATEHFGDPGAALFLDETGFSKKGTKTAGVARALDRGARHVTKPRLPC